MDASELKAGVRIAEFVLQEKIGQGGFGQVWKAVHHVWSDRVVAVKIPTDPGLIDQLRREAELQHALEKLDDAHILKTLGLDTFHDPPYFVMEYVEGRSLRQVLLDAAPLDLDTVLDYAAQILMALQHAHAAGVIHMDLKPENVLVDAGGGLKLMDFGFAVLPDPKTDSILLSGALGTGPTETGGTVEYMAPEVRDGRAPDPKADLYSFGVILFEMLTGERPQPGDLPGGLNPAAPRRLDEIFAKCYTRVSRRWETAGDILAEIRAMQAPAASASGAETPPSSEEDGGEKPPPAPERTGMALVHAGRFTLGRENAGDASPAQTRFLDDFHLDVTPVTNAQFLRFVREGGYENPALWGDDFERAASFRDASGAPGPRFWTGGRCPRGFDRHPVTGISVFEAQAYARFVGKRLPTEEEWEKAARGPDGHVFPWGERFEPRLANTKEARYGRTTEVGRFRAGASAYGLLDMAGNVLEWTSSAYKAYPGNEEPSAYFGDFYRVLRGGAWYFQADAARTFVRHFLRPDLRLDYVGFRLAADAKR